MPATSKPFRWLLNTSKWIVIALATVTVVFSCYLAVFFLLAPEYSTTPHFGSFGTARQIFDTETQQIAEVFPTKPRANNGSKHILIRNDFVESPEIVSTSIFDIPIKPNRMGDNRRPDYFLGGSPDTKADWTISGFLLIETFDESGLFSRAIVGELDGLTDGSGKLITRIGPRASGFGRHRVNISMLFPSTSIVHLRIQLLTTVGTGSATNLFIIEDRDDT